MTVIDNAIYVDGRRTDNPESLEETFETLTARNGFAWIDLDQPSPEELQAVADEFELHPLAVEDALAGHQRSKLERYGKSRFVVLRPATYLDDVEKVAFGEVHLFVGETFVVTVRRAETPDLSSVRRRLEENPELLARGPQAVLYAVLDRIVDDYAPVAGGLENDIDEIEDQLFDRTTNELSRRIYELSREVMLFQRATHPLVDLVNDLKGSVTDAAVDLEIFRGLRDVLDHTHRIVDRVDASRALLENALTTHLTLVGQDQNNQVKKISSWAAILFAPTLVGTIYGMNFDNMPELHWTFGYPLAVLAMVAMGGVLYTVFKRKGWL
ncbi:magnesium/cobalt transporter CorA [Agreia sp. COWG]|uniref:magnesium/cobalt transporter CorA n=1 Tax=Agreia sp. COWG TaxID=2773266 RepID=UPI0019286B1F|nr:magnesium/cobalt transporter CorA [Agreia sp. COWG]CAD5994301.1 Magnesium transport protein CorA [Agreia sp. COWG]